MTSESSEILEELPIFPLATVLFPGAVLPLHIFEDRYKAMMKYAIDNGGTFGLSYRSDAAIGVETPPSIDSVGCAAKINAAVPLADGKMNVISTGLFRYRVAGLSQSTPFVIARIEPVGDDLEPDEELNRIVADMNETCKAFLEAAQALDELNTVNPELPEEPEALSLLISSALPIDNDAKQALLEMTSTKQRLLRLRTYVTAAISQYEARLTIQQRARGNGHGKFQENHD